MLLQGAEGYGVRRKRPGEDFGGEADADQPELTAPSKPLTPDLTATTANGPIARVPAPMVGAPGPVLKAPEPITTPQAPQSVAGIALGTSAPKVNMAPPAAPGQPPAGPTPQVGAPEPIKTLSGEWTPPTASAQSAPLIASAAGGTMTPQGDSANSFRGYQTSQGGSFGGAFAEKGADAPLWSSVSNGDPQAIQTALSSADPALKQAAADAVSRMLTMNDTQGGGAQILARLSPEQRQAVQESFLGATGGFAADQAGYDPNRAKYAGAYKQTWDRITSGLDSAPAGLPAGRNAGNYTAKDPEEQQRLLADMAAGRIPSGPTPAVGAPGAAPEGVTATPGKVNTTTAGPAGGGGGAPAVGVGPSGTPAFPSTPSPSVGAPGDLTDLDPVQKAMRDETLRRLQNPSPYDDALWQKEVDRAKASSEEQWKRGRDNLDADLAARGINWSSIAGDKLSDFNTAKARSWDDVLTGFLSDRAKGIGAARDQAFNAGSTERNYYDKLRQDAISNQFDVTKLAEALRQGREGTAIDWTRLGLDALGNSTSGAADLGAGAAASAGNTGTGDYLAQWFAQYYGRQAPKPAVGTPAPAMAGAYG